MTHDASGQLQLHAPLSFPPVLASRDTVLHRAGAPIEQVYFPLSGMGSVLALMRTGDAIETAVVGREGVIGASVGTNGSKSAGEAVVQIAGSALQIRNDKFADLYKGSTSFSDPHEQLPNGPAAPSAAVRRMSRASFCGSPAMPLPTAIARCY
jgi:hypothetical protein